VCRESKEQRSEIRDQRSEIRDQRSEIREQRSEIRDQRSESRDQRAESREQRAESREPRAESREQRDVYLRLPCRVIRILHFHGVVINYVAMLFPTAINHPIVTVKRLQSRPIK
jgi:ATPase subunit of ABC transporter with duplicated ATPase domains